MISCRMGFSIAMFENWRGFHGFLPELRRIAWFKSCGVKQTPSTAEQSAVLLCRAQRAFSGLQFLRSVVWFSDLGIKPMVPYLEIFWVHEQWWTFIYQRFFGSICTSHVSNLTIWVISKGESLDIDVRCREWRGHSLVVQGRAVMWSNLVHKIVPIGSMFEWFRSMARQKKGSEVV